MQVKAVVIGLGVLSIMAGLYVAGQKNWQNVAAPETEMPVESNALQETLQNCPSMANSTILTFEDTHTDVTKKVIKSYEQAALDSEFLEPDKPRRIQYMDLNNDGREDFVTLYTGMNWCGSLGCSVEVFIQNAEGGYDGSQAFYTSEGQSVVLESTENGYRQMLSPVQHGGLPGEHYMWEWTGKKYDSNKHCLREELQ